MHRVLRRLLWLSCACAVAMATSVHAQDFPTKLITMVVPFPPGGSTDAVARRLAQQFQQSMGQSVIVENKPGAGGSIGTAAVARATPDGYTQLVVFDTHAVNRHIYKKLPFDTFKDFTGISQIASAPQILVVPASFPANSVKELVQLAKSKPNSVTYASAGPGSSNQLTAELFARTAAIQMSHVPYKGGGPMVNDLIGGHVNAAFISQPLVLAQIKAGKLKALAVTTEKRSALLPNVPTVAEQGYPGFDTSSWIGLVVPAETPKSVIDKLYAEVVKAAKSTAFQEKITAAGFVLVASSPDAFNKLIQSESERWGKLVKDAGITAE